MKRERRLVVNTGHLFQVLIISNILCHCHDDNIANLVQSASQLQIDILDSTVSSRFFVSVSDHEKG